MALTPEQVANAVKYFTTTIPKKQAEARFAARRGAVPTAPSAPTLSARDQLARNTEGQWWNAGPTAVASEILAPMDESETPTNFTQWLLNLLGTGTYAGANILQEYGGALDRGIKGDVGGAALQAAGAPLVGLGRGVGEGLGFRFDRDGDGKTERPRTHGQNLEDVGVINAVRGGVGALGGDEGAQNFAAGLTGFTADVALDPLTYVGGLGLLKGIRGGATAASQAAREGAGAVGSLRAGVQGAGTARRAAVAENQAARASRAEARMQRRSGGFASVADATRTVADDLVRGGEARAAEVPEAALLPEPEAVAGGMTPRVAGNRMAAVDELLPGLRATREIPTGQILDEAAIPGQASIPPQVAAELGDLARTATIPELRSALKTLRGDGQVSAFLRATVRAGGRQMSLGAALERAVTQRVTGRADPAVVESLLSSIDEALRVGAAVPRTTTVESMSQAIRAAVPDAEVDLDALMTRLGPASQVQRKAILQEVLGVSGERFSSFDDAMRAAVDGKVDAELMREMLKALGIRSKATRPESLRKLLGSQGQMNWEEIRDAVPTVREVATDHHISEADLIASAGVDTAAVTTAARGAYEASVDDLLGYDPMKLVSPERIDGRPAPGNASLGNGIVHIIERVGKLIKGKQGSEAYGTQVVSEMHRGAINTLRLRAGNTSGAARAAVMRPDYVKMMRITDEYLRSLGMGMGYKVSTETAPLYVGWGQLVNLLPARALDDALFNLAHRGGRDLTLYPNNIYAGAEAALFANRSGLSPEASASFIREAITARGGASKFANTADGLRAVDGLVNAMTDPAFGVAIRQIHEAQELVAVKLAADTADGLVQPITTRIALALARNGDRGELTAAIRDSYDQIRRSTESMDEAPTFAHDLAMQRLDSALVGGVLDEWGVAAMRFDSRAAAANAAGKVGGSQAADNVATYLEDIGPEAARMVDDALNRGEIDAPEAIMDLGAQWMKAGAQGIFGKVTGALSRAGVAAEGSFGQALTHATNVNAQRGLHALGSEYRAELRGWLHGTRQQPGLTVRLGEDLGLGRRASIGEVNANLEAWRVSLGELLRVVPDLPRGSMREALIRGMPQDASLGMRAPVAALSPAQADMAMDYLRMIDHVYAPKGGPLARSGLTADDVNPFLERFGQFDVLFDADLPLAAQTRRFFDADTVEDPLNALQGAYNAMLAASVRPTFVGALKSSWGHQASGLDRATALKQGWRPIDTEAGSMGKFFDDTLYPPEVRAELPYVQRAFDALDSETPRIWSMVTAPVDAIVGVIKPSMTIWRLGHHVTNILGTALMGAMKGYSPMHYIRGVKAMRQLPGTPVFDDEGFSALGRAWEANVSEGVPGFEGTVQPRALDDSATVALRGGQPLRLAPEQVVQLAQQRGLLQTAHQAKDLTPEREFGTLGGTWDRITRRGTPIGAIKIVNETLGRASAWYENASRLAVLYQALESRTWGNLDEALAFASREIQKVHPTREMLSAFDQRYTTKVVLFHNWVRGALGTVAEAALDRPGLVMIPSKWQYNMAEGAGLDPESLGKPIPSDPRIASYYEAGLLGPTWVGGESPFGGTGDLEEGAEPNLWGWSPSAPQFDALTSYLGAMTFGGDPLAQARSFAATFNPMFGGPIELLSNRPLGSNTMKPISDNYADWVWQQTGAPASLTNAVGLTGTHPSWTEAQNEGDVSRKLFNFLTGLKATNYTNPTSTTIAASERAEWEKAELERLGYTPEQIKDIRKYWRELRAADQ